MAYVPNYLYDVFVSYAWVNNYADPDGDKDSGWITRFKNRLQPALDERLGRGPSEFFFDRRSLEHNKDFDQRIEAALQKSATVVAFFSEGYLASPACGDEMRIFNDIAGANSGRLFLVHVESTDRASWPQEYHQYLKNIIGYQFYREGPIDGSSLKLQPGTDEFRDEFESLRTALASQLKSMKDQRAANTKPAESKPVPTVLVARTTPDLRKERKALVSYCTSVGLRVLPERNWPASPDEFLGAFDDAVKQSHLFVQLLSDCYADRPPDFPDGIETHQFQQATESGLATLQWRDKDTDLDDLDDDTHRALLTSSNVRTDLPNVFYQDVVKHANRSFEIKQESRHEATDSGPRLVLVKANESDIDPAGQIIQSLSEANIRCRAPHSNVPLVDRLRKDQFDALIVVLGDCPGDWIDDQGDELMAVDLNMKDQAPLRAYCHCGGRKLPPYVGRDMVQVVAPDELEVLIHAIQQQGAAK